MDVKVYTTPTCGYCHQLKGFLQERGVPFEEKDVSRDRAAAQEMVNLTGQMGVPVAVIGGETVIGFDRPRIEALLARRPARQGPKFGLQIADGRAGVLVGTVRPGGIGSRLGLASGDTITGVNDRPVRTAADLERFIAGVAPGNLVSMKFRRDGQPRKSEIIV